MLPSIPSSPPPRIGAPHSRQSKGTGGRGDRARSLAEDDRREIKYFLTSACDVDMPYLCWKLIVVRILRGRRGARVDLEWIFALRRRTGLYFLETAIGVPHESDDLHNHRQRAGYAATERLLARIPQHLVKGRRRFALGRHARPR